jgi:hypothetical protein
MFADGETRQVVVVVVEDAMYALAIVREPVCSLRGRYWGSVPLLVCLVERKAAGGVGEEESPW